MSLRIACGWTLSTALATTAATDTFRKVSRSLPTSTDITRSQV